MTDAKQAAAHRESGVGVLAVNTYTQAGQDTCTCSALTTAHLWTRNHPYHRRHCQASVTRQHATIHRLLFLRRLYVTFCVPTLASSRRRPSPLASTHFPILKILRAPPYLWRTPLKNS